VNTPTPDFYTSIILAVSLITAHSDLDFVNIMQLSSCTQDHKEMITCLIV